MPLATYAAPAWSLGPAEAGVLALAVLVVGALVGTALVLWFLYRTGRLGVRLAERGLDVTEQLGRTALDTTGKIAERASVAFSEGAGTIGSAMKEFARRQNSESIYAALMEMKPCLELTTCKLRTVVVAKKTRGRNMVIQMMPVQISYGFDFTEFDAKDIRVNRMSGVMRVNLPPLRVTAMERGPRKDLFSQAALLGGKTGMDLTNEVERALDEKMRGFAQSPSQVAIAEELSRTAFRQITDLLFYSLPGNCRPRSIQLVYSEETNRLTMPEKLSLDHHHDPDAELNDEEPEELLLRAE